MNDSAAGRLLGALIAPGKTFDSIAQRPTWVLAMLLHLVLAVGVGYLAVQHTDIGATTRQAIEKSGRTLTPEQVDQQVEMAEKIAKIAGPVAPFVFVPAMFLVVALVYWLGMRLVGGELRYPASLSVALHGMLPQAVAALLALPLMLNHGLYTQDELRRGVVASSFAFLAPEGASPAFVALLGSLDVFTFWSLGLLILGYRRAGRASATATSGVVLAVWVIYVLGKIGLTAAFAR
jgi:hypothetical protein